jgi:hypothetical protein
MFSPRTKLKHLIAELSKRTYPGAVYAKAQCVQSAFIRRYDGAPAEVDVLAFPTECNVANHVEAPPPHGLAAVEAKLLRDVASLPFA